MMPVLQWERPRAVTSATPPDNIPMTVVEKWFALVRRLNAATSKRVWWMTKPKQHRVCVFRNVGITDQRSVDPMAKLTRTNAI